LERDPGEFGARWNWVWLIAPPAWESALVVSSLPEPEDAPIARHFRRVTWMNPEGAHLSDGAGPPPSAGSFDCVALDVPLEALAGGRREPSVRLRPRVRRRRRQLLRRAGRALRPGGWLYCTSAGRRWSVDRGGGIRKDLLSAGFSEVHAYFAGPDLAQPRRFVPMTRPAVQTAEAAGDAGRWTRRLALASGAYPLLYTSRVFLARA